MNYILSLLSSIGNFLLTTSEEYDGLIIELIGGEIALITIFFTLLPIILDNSQNQNYLGYKLSDVFLYDKSNKNKMIKIWIVGIIIIVVNCCMCYFKYIILGFLCILAFLIYITIHIVNYLKFMSDKSEILKQIEEKANYELDKNCDIFIDTMTENSKNSINDFRKICYFLSAKENKDYLKIYLNKMIDNSVINKKDIYLEMIQIMKKEKCNLNINFDLSQFYRFIRNNITDNNLDEYYELLYIMTLNNYNIYKTNEDIQHLFLIIWNAISDSNLTDNYKYNFKKRMISNLLFIEKDIKSNDKNYFNIYNYTFMILKKIIFDRDVRLFKNYLNSNNYINIVTDELISDVYFSCYLYFYYLIEVEEEKYVSKNDKAIFEEMYLILKENVGIYEFVCNNRYYTNLNSFISNLEKISDSVWEIFDCSDGCDVKFCRVNGIVTNFKRLLYLIFNYKNTVDDKKYMINEQVVNCYKFEIEKGKIKSNLIDEIKKLCKFIDYDFERIDLEKFEIDFIEYVSQNFKLSDFNNKIDRKQLTTKLNEEKKKAEDEIRQLEIVNGKKCNANEEINYSIICSKSYLDFVIQNKSIMNSLEVVNGFEKYICKKIDGIIKNKVLYSFQDEKKVIDVLSRIKGKNYYIIPSKDMFTYRADIAEKYKEIIKKYEIINTNCYNSRFIIKNYSCELIDFSFSIEDIDNQTIKKKQKEAFISRNKYCINDSNGLDIFLTKKEIEEYLKNNEILLKFNIKYGLDIQDDKINTSFIRKG